MRRTLLLVGGGLTIAGALLPWVELHVTLHWSAGLGLWAMSLGAASALGALFTARD